MIFHLDEGHDGVTTSGEGPFMLFFTGEKVYHLREAAPVFQNAEKLFDAAKLALASITETIEALIESDMYEPAKLDYEARTALLNAIEACK